MGRRAVRFGGGQRAGDDGGRLGSGRATGFLTMMWAAGSGEGVIFFWCGVRRGGRWGAVKRRSGGGK